MDPGHISSWEQGGNQKPSPELILPYRTAPLHCISSLHEADAFDLARWLTHFFVFCQKYDLLSKNSQIKQLVTTS